MARRTISASQVKKIPYIIDEYVNIKLDKRGVFVAIGYKKYLTLGRKTPIEGFGYVTLIRVVKTRGDKKLEITSENDMPGIDEIERIDYAIIWQPIKSVKTSYRILFDGSSDGFRLYKKRSGKSSYKTPMFSPI